ncbi:MAG: redoxin domain-containing protein, partial [Deltaproteobacteria bacterium]|nr:redoxin domain-containing protein [Deltaproteobacteria bacterium]
MNKTIILLMVLVMVSCGPRTEDVSVIKGTVVGSDGEPVEKANINIVNFEKKNIKPLSLTQKEDGTFEIRTDSTGYMNIEFTGLDHPSERVTLLIREPEEIQLHVRLGSKKNQSDAAVKFGESDSLSAKYYTVKERVKEWKQNRDKEKVGEEIFQKIKTEQDADYQSFLCFSYMNNFFNSPQVDPEKAKEILRIIPPSSIVWTMNPNYLSWFWFILPKEDHDLLESYIDKVSHENNYPWVRAEAINYFLASAEVKKDSQNIQKFYKRLITECPESFRARDARFKYEILAPGKKVLSFSVISLDDPEVTYTDRTMLGSVYLMEFWVTTCGHCKREIPYLHEAYSKFKDKGFNILSLSLDDSPEVVKEFRKGEWKMPWYHTFLEGEFNNEIAEKFGVHGYPT